MKEFPGKEPIVKLTSCDNEENEATINEISSIAGKGDVIIANTGTVILLLCFIIYLTDCGSNRHE